MTEITDADREAAANWFTLHAGKTLEAELMREGKVDHWPLVRAFAHHRELGRIEGAKAMQDKDAIARELYQYSCNEAVGLARAGDIEGYKESVWFKLANALEVAFPDAIRALDAEQIAKGEG